MDGALKNMNFEELFVYKIFWDYMSPEIEILQDFWKNQKWKPDFPPNFRSGEVAVCRPKVLDREELAQVVETSKNLVK